MIEYFEQNNLLDNEQYGFRSNRSTTTAIINYIENNVDSLDKGKKVVGAFLDLTKAFDSVCH